MKKHFLRFPFFVSLAVSVSIAFTFLFSASSASAQDKNNNDLKTQEPKPVYEISKDDDLNAEQIIEQNKPALVSIWYHTDSYYSYYFYSTPKDTNMLSGSGFIFDSRGFVATNLHVIDGFDSLFVKTSDGKYYNADLIQVDEKNDIAILKIQNPDTIVFHAVKIGNSDLPRVGQSVYAIGSPLGFEYTISEGIIAALRENEKVSFNDPQTYALIERTFDRVIQITAAISPGNSGGALFNGKGEVIGITTYSYGFYGNLNFAIAINSFTKLRNSIDFAAADTNPGMLSKKTENLFNTNLRLADSYRSKLYSTWYYTKERDTMKTYDSMIVKQDSLNRINFKKAEQFYNLCLEMKPDTFLVYQNMMDLYVYTENFTKAEDLYVSIKEKFQSDSLLNTLSSSLASAYSTSKDYKKALVFYEKMYKRDTTDIYILYQIGDINTKQKDYDKAEKTFNRLIKKDPTYILAYVQLGKINYERKDYKAAKKYLDDAFEKVFSESYQSSDYLDLHYYRGMLAVKEGNKLEAIMAYMDIKSIYTYTKEESDKKLALYKAILKMEN
ncbi:MAG: trypsin-like peptidase domain-containing protein [Bacteroidetes bacterium]|nr:trypsin-like peptidase domain-containing protein [Bacteroidota bacterium]